MSAIWETLPPAMRERLEAGEAAMKWLHRGESVERWREVGDAVNGLQTAAMELAMTNKAAGRNYNKAWSDLAEHVPHLRDLNSATRAHASWMATNWETVQRWLFTLAANQRMQLNHPTTIRRKYDAAHRVPEEKDAGLSPVAQARQTIMEQQEEIDRLRRMAGEGSLFDLKRDTAEQIGRVILNTIGENKVTQLIKTLSDGQKEKRRKRAAHAG